VLGPVCRTTDPRDETIPLAWAQVMVRVVEPDWAMALVDTHVMARVMRMDFMLQLPLIVACPPNKLNSAQFRYGTCRNNASRRAKGVKAMLHGNVAGAGELEQTCLASNQAILLNKMSSQLMVPETSVSRWSRFIGPLNRQVRETGFETIHALKLIIG
jgi:hypothetical protein